MTVVKVSDLEAVLKEWKKSEKAYSDQQIEYRKLGLPFTSADYSLGCYKTCIHDLEQCIKKHTEDIAHDT